LTTAGDDNFQILLDNIEDMVFLLNKRDFIQYCNRPAREHFKMAEPGDKPIDPRRRKDFLSLWSSDSGKCQEKLKTGLEIARITSNKVSIQLENDIQESNFAVELKPLCQEDGEEILMVTIREITGQVKMERAQFELEERLTNIFEALPVGVLLVDVKTSQVLESNIVFKKIIGCENENIRGIDCCWQERLQKLTGFVENRQSLRNKEVVIPKQDGQDKICLWNAVYLEFGQGGCYLHSFVDISDRKQAEDELKAAYRKIRTFNQQLADRVAQEVESNRKKDVTLMQQSRLAAIGEMIANIAHQWRQPLSGLGIIIQDIKDAYNYQELDEKYLDESIQHSRQLIAHMSDTIDDFRSFFNSSSSEKQFDLSKNIERTLNIISANIKTNGISIEKDFQENISLYGFGNEYSQVLINIINNAKDELAGRKIDDPRILISTRQQDNEVIVDITDNAGGIPEDVINHVFEPYFTTKGEADGTGIGLYMSREIIENKMKGRLSVTNTEEGARFQISVPVGRLNNEC